MKTILTIIIAVLFSGVVFGQVKVDTENKTITINTTIDSIDVIVDRGKFTLNIEGAKSYSIKKGAKY